VEPGEKQRRDGANGAYFNVSMAEGPVFFDTTVLVVFGVVGN
jgi:hypothetical protein